MFFYHMQVIGSVPVQMDDVQRLVRNPMYFGVGLGGAVFPSLTVNA